MKLFALALATAAAATLTLSTNLFSQGRADGPVPDPFPNAIRLYPANPVGGETVYVVVNYPCVPPSIGVPTQIQRVENNLSVRLALLGNACFSSDQDRDFEWAFPIGSFTPGKFGISVVHGISIDDRTIEPSSGQTRPLTGSFTVANEPSDTISGNWSSDEIAGEMVLSKIDNKKVEARWQTFDVNGVQRWLKGTLEIQPNGELLGPVSYSSGPNFFNPAVRGPDTSFGTISVEQMGCDRFRLRFATTLPNFGVGAVDFINRSRPIGIRSCEPTDLKVRNPEPQ